MTRLAAFLLLLPAMLGAQTFAIGRRVHVAKLVMARADSLGLGTKVLRAVGDAGTITAGPTGPLAGWGISWYIHYDAPPDGWSSQQYLALDSTPAPAPPAVAVIKLNVAGTLMISAIGGTWQSLAVVLDSAGRPLATPVTWRSSSPAIASVDANGLVTALASGADTIVASAGGKSAFFLLLAAPSTTVACIDNPPPLGCGMSPNQWRLLGVDTVSRTYGPWFQMAPGWVRRKVVRVIVSDTTP